MKFMNKFDIELIIYSIECENVDQTLTFLKYSPKTERF